MKIIVSAFKFFSSFLIYLIAHIFRLSLFIFMKTIHLHIGKCLTVFLNLIYLEFILESLALP